MTVDATRPVGPADRAASGILHSVAPGPSAADMARLGVTSFRGVPACCTHGLDWTEWDAATGSGSRPATTLILSDMWSEGQGGRPATPWSDWAAYSRWVSATVRYVLSTGRRPTYWEVYNEPDSPGAYYPAAEAGSVTTGLVLQQFLAAYRAIKAVDPGARVIGPSLSRLDAPYLAAFVAFAAAHGIRLAALTWHENGPPSLIASDVAYARRLLSARPATAGVPIDINEYGARALAEIPGWDVAYLSALTAARVDSAGRSCWSGGCWDASLDGLLTAAGRPRPVYFARLAYAAMTGSMVATSSSGGLSSLASWDPARRQLLALVGRAVGVTTRRRPVAVSIRVILPFPSSHVRVRVAEIAGAEPASPSSGAEAVSDTAETSSRLGPSSSTVTVRLPAFADGDAYTVEITPG